MMSGRLPADLALGPVALTVADRGRSLTFYHDVLGFRPLEGSDGLALTADGATPLVQLTVLPGARPKPPRATGLYHFAILVPDRAALGRSLRRLAEVQYPLDGASDHGVSEALYLADPDGNGIEIYTDRPRAEWPFSGEHLQMTTLPLDLAPLFEATQGQPWEGLELTTRIGHVHLHIANLQQAEAFYCDILGFDLMQHYGSSAAFVSAGGYHHHIGLNTWAGVGVPPPPPGSAGLRHFTLVLPDTAARDRVVQRLSDTGVVTEPQDTGVLVRDPSGNQVRLVSPLGMVQFGRFALDNP
jgi:catechol 2,3-dioxygenase